MAASIRVELRLCAMNLEQVVFFIKLPLQPHKQHFASKADAPAKQ
jgi:hypothetical protein